MPSHDVIYKILTASQWTQIKNVHAWLGSEDDQRDGFIHFSTRDQVDGTIQKHFSAKDALVLARFSVKGLGKNLRWEASRGNALFPHLYAPLTKQSLLSVEPYLAPETTRHRRVLYFHGWQSQVGGVKPSSLEQQGHTVLQPSLDHDDFEAAMRTAETWLADHPIDIVVGSSRGGALAANLATVLPRVLLCPAWKKWGTVTTIPKNTLILHSRHDEVVPYQDSVDLLCNSMLPNDQLIDIGQEHRLADSDSLAVLQSVVNRLPERAFFADDQDAKPQ
ncbi:MAG: DUF952 domain-containing protein [Planctomycetota bacterium]